MQAALGLAQLQKLGGFIETRRRNFDRLTNLLSKHTAKLILPQATPHANPSWFGYLITVKPDAGITRDELVQYLNSKKIATRLLFAGDIRKQPYFKKYQYRSVGELKNTEIIMKNTFWVGVTPMINDHMIDYMSACIGEALTGQMEVKGATQQA
jgi:CDP-6-deoxy-D-xylo-4-hexulose-3-dehydrase